jgi:hypothetical protein
MHWYYIINPTEEVAKEALGNMLDKMNNGWEVVRADVVGEKIIYILKDFS